MKFVQILFVIPLFFISCNMHEGGVRTSNNMEKYAIEYIKENNLLEAGETVSAYYDYTISLDGSEAAILTNTRLIYHNEDTQTTYMNIDDIVDVQSRTESFIGDIIEVSSRDGDMMMIEIAPLNQGATFLKVLKAKVY